MKKKAIGLAAFVSVSAGLSCGADTLTWYGPEGGLWSKTGNWTNSVGEAAVPQDGDRLVIPSRVEAMTLENDIDNLTLRQIVFSGSGASVTLKGKAYALDNPDFTNYNVNNKDYFACCPFLAGLCVVTNEPPVMLKSSRTDNRNTAVCSSNELTFVSTVSSDVPGYTYIEGGGNNGVKINFLESLIAPSATLLGRTYTTVYFKSPIHVKYVCYPERYSGAWSVFFQASGNLFEELMIGPFGTFVFAATDCVPADTVLRWNYGWPGNSSSYSVRAATTIDHIAAFEPPLTNGQFDDKKYRIGGNSGPLTLRSTVNLVTYVKLDGCYFDFVWDPVGDYTCEFRDRVHVFSGYGLKVNRGKVVLAGETVMTNKTLALGQGAAVDIAATNGVVMPTLAVLDMAKNSRLYITNAAVNAFTAGSPALTIGDGAVIEIGDAAVAPVFKTVLASDSIVPAGNYTGEDGVEGAVKVPWLRGSAVVTVENTVSVPGGQTHWKDPVDGDWNDATKWTHGVPTSSRAAYITAFGADYTVTVTEDVPCAVGLALGADACLDVQKGGVCRVGGSESSVLKIKPGAKLLVSGGTCILTNHVVRKMSIEGTSSKTATVTVTSGSLMTYRDSVQPFRVGDYAVLDVSGGEVVMDNNVGYAEPYERVSVAPEGRVNISGTGKFRISRSYTGARFGSGMTTFSDDAVYMPVNAVNVGGVVCGANHGVRAENPGETAVLTFKDRAMHEFAPNSGTVFLVGDTGTNSATCRVIANFNSSAVHGASTNGVALSRTPQIAYRALVGCGSGYGELNVTDGFVAFGTYGTFIGSVPNKIGTSYEHSLGCTGICNVAGGVFVTHGARGWDPVPLPPAMLIGWGWPTQSEPERPYNGFMNVTGGVVSNVNCSTVIGMGKGYGEWRQKGGKTILVAEGVKVGLAGGVGLLSVSGGTFTSTYDTYIGGAPVTAFNKGAALAGIGYPTDRHDGVGTLTVSGGRFEVTGYSSSKLYVGLDGDGTVEMDGPNGELVVPQLVLAAGTVDAGTENEAQTKATLRFKLDADGRVAPITVTSTMTVSEDSELVIDATACPEDVFGRLKLINADAVTGDFAPENITVLGAPRTVSESSVIWRGKSLCLSLGRRGTVVTIR